MKVAFYNHTGEVSGAEISLLLTARHLRGVRPVIFAPAGELLERARKMGLETAEISRCRARFSRNPLRLLAGFVSMLLPGLEVAAAAQGCRADIVHANNLRSGIIASLFAWLHRRPVVWHVRDMPPGGLVGKSIRRMAALTASAVVGISRSVLNSFERGALQRRLHLVYNGVTIRDFSELERRMWRKKIREELETPMDAKVIAIIGQIAPWKRQEDAILAARMLAEKGMDVYLWVVGEAKFRKENAVYEKKLHHMAGQGALAGRVRFTGFRIDITEICCAADLLVLCSDGEPFGRVLIEAMSVSLPVVATDAGGVPEIVEHGVTGLLYPVGEVRRLAEHAERLLCDELGRRRMGIAAAERVREHFAIESSAARLEQIYRQIMFSRKSKSAASRTYHHREKKVHDAEV